MKIKESLNKITEDNFFSLEFWNYFKKDFETWLSKFSFELKKIFSKKLKDFTQSELEDYLYVSACRDYMNNYQSSLPPKGFYEKIKIFKKKTKEATYIYVNKYSDDKEFSESQFFKFFHRHEKLFPVYSKKDRGALKNKKKIFFIALYPKLKKLLEDCSFETTNLTQHVVTLLLNIDCFLNIKKLPKNIFTSAHWVQNNSLHQAFLTYAKSKGTTIYILQPGYFHPLGAFYDQFEFEKRLASFIITWQEGLLKNQLDITELGFGSLYCKRNYSLKKGTCIVLPQIPRFNFVRGQSKSFGLGNSLFLNSKAFLHIKNYVLNLANSSNKIIYLRTKNVDFAQYKDEFDILKDKIQFDTSNINSGGYLTPYEEMKIGYFGTAIPESFFSGSSVSLIYHEKNEIILNISNSNFYKKSLANSIHETCKPAEIERFIDLFSKLNI